MTFLLHGDDAPMQHLFIRRLVMGICVFALLMTALFAATR